MSTMERPVIGRDDDPDFLTDLRIITRREPGKGQAFQRMLDRAGMTHDALAQELDCGRTRVTNWCSEFRWPDDAEMRNALLALRIDRKLILNECGPALVMKDAEFDPKALAVTLYQSLFGENDPFERERLIYDSLWEKTLIAMGFKALRDVRAFLAFTEQREKWQEERRLRSQNSVRDVTPRQANWAAGEDVLKPAKSRRKEPEPESDSVPKPQDENPEIP
jgi:hypothetical protein